MRNSCIKVAYTEYLLQLGTKMSDTWKVLKILPKSHRKYLKRLLKLRHPNALHHFKHREFLQAASLLAEDDRPVAANDLMILSRSLNA